MHLLRNLIRPYLYARYGFHRITGTGAFGRERARQTTTGLQPHWNRLKRSLWASHVKQLHESSCSVASVVTCLNAIHRLQNGHARPITQTEILDRVTTGHWKARMSAGGYRGRRGLPLPLLGQVVQASIAAYGLKVQRVEVVQAPPSARPGSPVRVALKNRLRRFERHGNALIIAHFDQGQLIPALNIPHISPVGGWDEGAGRVTVLDVDPDQGQPYQVTLEAFYRGLSSNYHRVFAPYGYGSGGYVYLTLG